VRALRSEVSIFCRSELKLLSGAGSSRHGYGKSILEAKSMFFKALLLATSLALSKQGTVTPGIPVLCYHDFQPVAQNDMVNTPGNFEEHLRWLKEHGYRTLSVDEMAAVLKGREREPEKAVVITFDDGYQGVYRYAYPLLKKYGMQGTLFLVTSKIGDENPPMPHLTWQEIEEMDREGVVRAAVHADAMHVKLGQRLAREEKLGKAPNDIKRDLTGARHDIESHVHHPVHTIAWPYGDYNTDLIHLACKLGYNMAFNTEYGVNRPGDNVLKIKRLRMSSKYDTVARFEKKLATYGLH